MLVFSSTRTHSWDERGGGGKGHERGTLHHGEWLQRPEGLWGAESSSPNSELVLSLLRSIRWLSGICRAGSLHAHLDCFNICSTDRVHGQFRSANLGTQDYTRTGLRPLRHLTALCARATHSGLVRRVANKAESSLSMDHEPKGGAIGQWTLSRPGVVRVGCDVSIVGVVGFLC